MWSLTLVFLCVGIDPVSDDKKMREGKGEQGGPTPMGDAPTFSTEALTRIVELARQELRDKGLSEELIATILHRRYPPNDL